MKESWRFTAQKVGFPYTSSGRPIAKVRTPKLETQCLIRVRTLQQMMESVAHGPKDGPNGPSNTEVCKFLLAKSPNVYAVTADGGTTLCNRSDARVSRSGRAPVFYKFQLQVWTPRSMVRKPPMEIRVCVKLGILKPIWRGS
jgi:hypothetical protein